MSIESYENLFKRVTKKYFAIKHVYSPNFPNEQIYFDNKGYRHFFYNGAGKPRPIKDTRCRLSIFDDALKTILTPKMKFTVSSKKGKGEKRYYYWSVKTKTQDGRHFCVIVRAKGKNGQKHYYDVIPQWRYTKKLP